ncbi:MAG: ABC transporter permease subunit [Bdellovibrionaceae bacterium]|jgi:microcin C transport system permease protein|nr:ABC transporter permease subunit [Pseudobdellovibrionaceae bacterium]
MTAYFVRRVLLIIPTFIGITLLVFTITRFVPGGPVERMLAQMQAMGGEGGSSGGGSSSGSDVGSNALSPDQIKELEAYYGFDKPVFISYVLWLKKVVSLDLGTSTRYSEPVWDTIKERFPVSTFYGISTLILVYLICIPLGIIKAIKHNSIVDNLSSIFVFIGYAIPNYVVGIAVIYLFASYFEFFPMGGFVGDEFEDLSTWEQFKDLLHHAVLPLISYVAGSFAVMTILMKNSMMDNLAADYVRTAMAKGLSFNRAVVRHAMRNSLIPIATSFGNNISVLISGSFLIEFIFNIDGMGLLGYESIVERDYPIVMGILVISSILFMVGNILSDICVAIVDPRVQFK